MMSNEHGKPERATGAQGAGESADGVSRNGGHGYSALTGGTAPAADESWNGAGGYTAPAGGSSAPGGFSASSQTREYETLPGQAGAGPGEPSFGQAGFGGTGSGGTGSGGPEWPPQPADGQGADDHAAAAEEEEEQPAKKSRRASGWRELPILIVVALTIALVIKTFVVQPFFIPSSSMEDTLLIGDKVLVNKLVYHFRSIQPGDIIVFNGDGSWNPNPTSATSNSNFLARAYDDTLGKLFHSIAGLFGTPVGQTDYIKRVIGTPGDHVVCCNAQGLVTVNGVPLHEASYLFPGAAPSQIKFNIVVPPGRLWVMGDNRSVSDDSRLRMSDPGQGTIPENKVIGRAFVIVWPPSRWRILDIPATFNQPGISRPGSAQAGSAAADRAVTQLLGARVAPEPSYLPLGAGVVGALPLTWLQIRIRRRVRNRLRRRQGKRGPRGSSSAGRPGGGSSAGRPGGGSSAGRPGGGPSAGRPRRGPRISGRVRPERDRLRRLGPHRHS
jgi:signal peptidase I